VQNLFADTHPDNPDLSKPLLQHTMNANSEEAHISTDGFRFAFIHVNKCGGTSFKRVLKKCPHIFIPKNNEIARLLKKEWFRKIKKFTVTRDPIDRFRSLVRMIWRDKDPDIPPEYVLDAILSSSVDFVGANTLEGYIKRHGLPMSHPHYGLVESGRIIIDNFYRLEEVDKAWPQIKTSYNIPDDTLPQVNSTSALREPVTLPLSYLEKFAVTYCEDFELFGYGEAKKRVLELVRNI
jgi:hypothetical protein